MCRIEYVGGVQGYAAPLIIQTGEVVEVVVALAYVLASRLADTRRWSLFVEEAEALGEVLADLAGDQPAQPQQEMEKSSARRHVGEETAEKKKHLVLGRRHQEQNDWFNKNVSWKSKMRCVDEHAGLLMWDSCDGASS